VDKYFETSGGKSASRTAVLYLSKEKQENSDTNKNMRKKMLHNDGKEQ